MIHYTLLPENEIKALKREYHIRVFIVLIFYISFVVLIGIVFLLPSYMLSSIHEKDSLSKLESIQKDKKARGIDITLNNLRQSNDILSKLIAEDNQVNFSDSIKKFVEYRPPQIKFNSLQLSNVPGDKSLVEIIVQGKSTTRESLLDFKKSLSTNTEILNVEFPLPDLTKSKDVSFAVKFKMRK